MQTYIAKIELLKYCLVQFKYANYSLNGHTGCYYYCMI